MSEADFIRASFLSLSPQLLPRSCLFRSASKPRCKRGGSGGGSGSGGGFGLGGVRGRVGGMGGVGAVGKVAGRR